LTARIGNKSELIVIEARAHVLILNDKATTIWQPDGFQENKSVNPPEIPRLTRSNIPPAMEEVIPK
jgi:hypothetical protein